MIKKLSECLEAITSVDNGDVFVFSPCLGEYTLTYQQDLIGYNYKLTIPFEDKTVCLSLDDENLKKLAVLLGIGSKHFDVLIKSEEKIISNIKELLDICESDIYFLANGSSHAVSDVSINTEPVKLVDLLNGVKEVYKTGTDDSDPNDHKDWTDESLNDELYVYYYSYINGITSLAFGLKYKSTGYFLKCNRLGTVKTTLWPCWFKKMNDNEEYVPVIFDIYGITETKPVFKQNVDLLTNLSTIMTESDDFLYDNKRKLDFELQRQINPDQYLKHLSVETKIPKKYIKKGIICGDNIKSIVYSICNECLNLIHSECEEAQDENDIIKNSYNFERLSKAAGYSLFYQDRFCNCCYKTTTIAEEVC